MFEEITSLPPAPSSSRFPELNGGGGGKPSLLTAHKAHSPIPAYARVAEGKLKRRCRKEERRIPSSTGGRAAGSIRDRFLSGPCQPASSSISQVSNNGGGVRKPLGRE